MMPASYSVSSWSRIAASFFGDERDVLAAAAQLVAVTDIDEAKTAELDALVERAEKAGNDVTVDALTDELEEHEIEVPSYSWVHLNDFRLLELHGRCYHGRLWMRYSTQQTISLDRQDRDGNNREGI
jgi:hypothetical protein